MVRQALDPNEFDLELEKMVTKCMYDDMFNRKEDNYFHSRNDDSTSPPDGQLNGEFQLVQ